VKIVNSIKISTVPPVRPIGTIPAFPTIIAIGALAVMSSYPIQQ